MRSNVVGVIFLLSAGLPREKLVSSSARRMRVITELVAAGEVAGSSRECGGGKYCVLS